MPVAVFMTGYSGKSLMRVISRIKVPELSLFGAPIGTIFLGT
jgi:hypothetical protein